MRAKPTDEPAARVMQQSARDDDRLRGRARAGAGAVSETAAADFLRALLRRELTEREQLLAHGRGLSLEVEDGASVIVARAHPQAPTDEGWRARVRAVAERGARAVVSRSIAALSEREGTVGAEVLLLVPGGEEAMAARAADAVLREMEAGLAGYTFALGRSRIAEDPAELPAPPARRCSRRTSPRAGGRRRRSRSSRPAPIGCCCSAMSENPSELQRFYAETVEPLVAYDEQYETDLMRTLATFLEADGNVAGTAQRLFTHRHTIYYRLERVRELSGLDVSSSDGREKLSLGLKSMRVLGISSAGGPASEAGAEGGRVPRPLQAARPEGDSSVARAELDA